MAIYHLSMKIISRSSGYSAVALLPIVPVHRMLDERTDFHDYTRKSGVVEAVILTPPTPLPGVRTVPNSGMPLRRPNAGRTHNLRGKIELAIPHELPQESHGNRSRLCQRKLCQSGHDC